MSLANPSGCSVEEMRLVQALRLKLRRLQLELGEAREFQVCAERRAEEYHVQGEALEEMRRCHQHEARRLARQRHLELRHQASLREQLHEVHQALHRTERLGANGEVPWQVHSALQRHLGEAKEQLQRLRGCGDQLQQELRAAQLAPPPKTQDLPRPAWVGDRPLARKDKDSCLSSPRTPSMDGSMLSRQVCATKTLRSELVQLQETLKKEQQRQKALQRREEILEKRQKQLEAALKQSRSAQAADLNALHAELQEGGRHVQRLLDFAMQAPGVAALQSLVSDAGLHSTPRPETEVVTSAPSSPGVVVKSYGILGCSNKERKVAPPGEDTILVDPAGLPFISGEKGPKDAKGAAQANYCWLEINEAESFPQEVKAAITEECQAKYYAYAHGKKKCIHVVGPDLRKTADDGAYSVDQAVEKLAIAYGNVFEEFFAVGMQQGLRRMRLLPISGGIFSGDFKKDLPTMTARAVQVAYDQLSVDKKLYIVNECEVEMCIFMESEFDLFASAFDEVQRLKEEPRGSAAEPQGLVSAQ